MADIPDDERTNPIGLFNTARSYWQSAEYLNAAKLGVTHPHAPVTFLYCHAIELYLKAYLRAAGSSLADLKRIGHRVSQLADAAASFGLKLDSEHAELLSHVEDEDVAIEARYIVTGFSRQPAEEALAKVAARLDETVIPFLMRKGYPVREERFDRPAPQPRDDDLGEDTTRVLIALFQAKDGIAEVRNIAGKFGMPRNVLQYHLDRLSDAKLAESAGGNYRTGDVYWCLTPDGRRYVMERKLVG